MHKRNVFWGENVYDIQKKKEKLIKDKYSYIERK